MERFLASRARTGADQRRLRRRGSKVGRELYENFSAAHAQAVGIGSVGVGCPGDGAGPTRTNREIDISRYISGHAKARIHAMFANMLDHPNIRIMLNADIET